MQWNTGRSYKLDRARHNKQENYEVPINKRKRRFKKGGAIDDKKAMVLSQIKEVHHHADELAKVLANMDTVDAWVVGKMERATTDLSDITHYLDGTTEYAKGGKIEPIKLYRLDEMEDGTIRLQSQLYIGKDTADFIMENGVVKFYNKGKNGFGYYEYKEPYIIVDDISMMKNQPLEKGGMMAKGGMTKNNFDVIVRTPKGLVTKKDFDGFTKEEIIKWCEDRGWVYNPKGEKFGGSILKEYEFFIKVPTKNNVILPKKKTKGIDLFEDYQDIPTKVQKVLDKYQEDIEDGDYKGLEKALKELEKIGYTFEYGLDGIAYDLRPIGTQGKSEFMEF
jgi:hypothetical protein